MGNDSWMSRMAAHIAMKEFFDFLVETSNPKKCVGIRIKGNGEDIMEGDPRLKEMVGEHFKTLNDACFYDFGKDIEACCEK